MHTITEQILGNNKKKDMHYTVYPDLTVVAQLVRYSTMCRDIKVH
jgi:hypothetical protein